MSLKIGLASIKSDDCDSDQNNWHNESGHKFNALALGQKRLFVIDKTRIDRKIQIEKNIATVIQRQVGKNRIDESLILRE